MARKHPQEEEKIPTTPTSKRDVDEVIGFGGRNTLKEVQAEHARVLSVGNKLDGAFTMLQIEAISLADFLQRYIDSLKEQFPEQESSSFEEAWRNARTQAIALDALYKRHCAPEVNRFMQRAKIEMGYTSERLEAYKDHVRNIGNIETVRTQLWLFVIRSLHVDFSGEIWNLDTTKAQRP